MKKETKKQEKVNPNLLDCTYTVIKPQKEPFVEPKNRSIKKDVFRFGAS